MMNEETLQEQRNRIAAVLYGHKTSYNALSAWARMSVDATILHEAAAVTVAPESLQEDSLHHRISTLEDQLELAKKENHDLWEENEHLKMEIEDNRVR